jgi:3-hydroxyacyl-[acyl-carrier-protein] dehydratase
VNFPHPSSLIPQAHPFLFVDEIVAVDETSLQAKYTWKQDEYFFQGHFPGRPVVPGVILCEMLLQCGALWMALQKETNSESRTPVVTRIKEAKFKKIVAPLDCAEAQVHLLEKLGEVAFFRGKITVGNQVALTLEFAVTSVDASKEK